MAIANIKISKTDQGGNSYNLTMKKLTAGELMALTRALCFYDSAVGNDVLAYLRNAIHNLGDTELTKTIEESLQELTKKC